MSISLVRKTCKSKLESIKNRLKVGDRIVYDMRGSGSLGIATVQHVRSGNICFPIEINIDTIGRWATKGCIDYEEIVRILT